MKPKQKEADYALVERAQIHAALIAGFKEFLEAFMSETLYHVLCNCNPSHDRGQFSSATAFPFHNCPLQP